MFEEVNDNADLDVVFRNFIDVIKTKTLTITNKEKRQVVTAWINKLCESSLWSNSDTDKKNRNLYAQILMNMLHKSELKKPFTEKPNAGKLPTIPVYMSSYLDDTHTFSDAKTLEGPTWMLAKDLDDSMLLNSFSYDNSSVDKRKKPDVSHESCLTFPVKDDSSLLFQIPEATELEYYLSNPEKNMRKEKKSKTPLLHTDSATNETDEFSIDETSLLQKFENIANKFNYTPSQGESTSNARKECELDKKLECLEKKIEVESTKIQQQQDAMVKNILDRKNNEMSDIKTSFQKKIEELEMTLRSRDETISSLNVKLNSAQEQYKKETSKLRIAFEAEESIALGSKEFEHKMNAKVESMESEMKNLRRSHFEYVEKLVAENEVNIVNAKEHLTKENKRLAEKIEDLTSKVNESENMMTNLVKERDASLANVEECQSSLKKLQLQLSEANEKLQVTEKEKTEITLEKRVMEKHLSNMQKEAAKTTSMILDLQSKLDGYKCTIENIEANRLSEVKEVEIKSKEELIALEVSLNKQIQTIQNDFDLKERKYVLSLEQSAIDLKLKDKQIQNLNELHRKQIIEAKRVIEYFKVQTEKNVTKMVEEFNVKLFQLQSKVATSHEKINAQKVNIALCLENLCKNYESKHLKYKSEMDETMAKHQKKYRLDLTQYNEKLVRQRLAYEEKLQGLLPLHVKVELEDTIEALKQQIAVLQSQTELLQEELDTVSSINITRMSQGFTLIDT